MAGKLAAARGNGIIMRARISASSAGHRAAANAISTRVRSATEQRGDMMGRMMAFIVVVVCTAQVVLLRAQERIPERTQEPTLDSSNPRFAYHKIDDGYLRLDLRSGEVATCRPQPGGWTCTLAAEERTALENEIARLQRDNALLKNALLEHGLPLPSPSGETSTPPAAGNTAPPVAGAPTAEAAPPRPPAPIPPPQADAREQGEIDRVISTMERLWRRVVELMAVIQRDIQGKD
jgi:hypothetical protein